MAESKNEVFWGEHSEDYDSIIDTLIGKESRSLVFDEVAGIQNLGSVVEFGCGPGYFTRAVARNASHVLATDLSDRMLAKARANLREYENVSFSKANCEHTSFPDEHFDSVFMANVLLVLEHPAEALTEALRILKPGGRLVLVNYTNHGLGVFDQFVFAIRFFTRIGKPPYGRMMSPDEILAMVEKAGFKIEEMKLIGAKVKAVFLVARKSTSI